MFERILLKIDYEIESCENRIDECQRYVPCVKLKERMKTLKYVRILIEHEANELNDNIRDAILSPIALKENFRFITSPTH